MFMSRILLISTFCCALIACGGEDPKPSSDAGAAVDTTVDSGGALDSGAVDTGSVAKDTGSVAKDTGSVAKDTTKPATPCYVALHCVQDCPKGDAACQSKCGEDTEDSDGAALKDIATCAVDLCKEVSEGTASEQNCAFDKCFDKYDSCGAFGSGATSCVDTVGCVATCSLTDFACKLECMRNADKAAVTIARDVLVCAASKCGAAADQNALSSCISTECATAVAACVGDAPLGCPDIVQQTAKCTPSSVVNSNNCLGMVMGLADAAGRTAFQSYGTCKDQCTQAVNVVGCWIDKCASQAEACFPSTGSSNCQDLDKCALDDCEGIGGDPDCIKKCIGKGKSTSQDAYLLYEGCMVRNMNTKEAKTVNCMFPYDQSTCVPVIKGQFCGSEAQNCFTDQ